MAITNKEIITMECALRDIEEAVNTYKGWEFSGYQVKRGQKALFSTRIWRPVKSKKDNADKLILVKAAFFGASQVEKIEKAGAL